MLIRTCIYTNCEHEFEYKEEGYFPCPKCGAGTVVLEAKYNAIPKEAPVSEELLGKHRDNIASASLCMNAVRCQQFNTYRPECETDYKQATCTINLNLKTDYLVAKVTELLKK